jgi:hypothetical protein
MMPVFDGSETPEEAALAYAEAGWYVIPVDREFETGKNPGSILGKDWPTQSSRDPDQIRDWFSGAWRERNIALHVGRSGAVAIDHDNGRLPEVLEQALVDVAPPHQYTPSGGHHYLFAQPPGRSIGNSGGKLGSEWGEVRGHNGVIIVYPSALPEKGAYDWDDNVFLQNDMSIPVLPTSIAELLPDAGLRDRSATADQRQEFLDRYTEGTRPEMLRPVLDYYEKKAHAGSRHETLVHCACWAMREARAGFYAARTAWEALWQTFQDTAGQERFIDTEFEGIIDWAIGQARALSDTQLAEAVAEYQIAVTDEEVSELEAKLLDTEALDDLPDPRWLVAGWLEMDTIARMTGKSRHGKSFVALDLAAAIGGGLDWHGSRVLQGEVIYMAAEGAYGMKKRVRAWETTHARRMRGVYLLPEALQVRSRDWDVLCELVKRRKPALIILDTQARVTVGLDENDASEMGHLVNQMEKMRQVSGACVMAVHHLGHNGREGRGSTAVIGALTSEILVAREDNGDSDGGSPGESSGPRIIRVECMKQKNAEDGEIRLFEMRQVELGHDIDGNPVTSAVIKEPVQLEEVLRNWERHYVPV